MNLQTIKDASYTLAQTSYETRVAVLKTCADLLASQPADLLKANLLDLDNLRATRPDATPAFIDRLTLTPARIHSMQTSLLSIASINDPLGTVVEERKLENRLLLRKIRVPIGVCMIIFESRPNVAMEAFSIAFKSGNCSILRGGKESAHTVSALYAIIYKALEKHKLPKEILTAVTNPDRDHLRTLLKEDKYIDVVIPRGGDSLIQFVVENSRIPIIKNDRGLCHIYVHSDANLESAVNIIHNAKTQRPGVCNAMETLLVHQDIAGKLLPAVYAKISPPVEWHCDPASFAILSGKDRIQKAAHADFDTEWLDYKMNCRIVAGLQEAISHIRQHGSRHSESILAQDSEAIARFQREVDAAVVYSNASTRFTDGFEFGFGGEIGISTQKLHVRGPVGSAELTSLKWVVTGNGQIRG